MEASATPAALRPSELIHYLDDYLRVGEVPDYPHAHNGLQVFGGRPVATVAVAVDAAQATIDSAVEGGADVLIVHHGLFWDGNPRLTERRYRRVKRLMDADIALYSAHLPLDVHPEVGNNSVLARALGIEIDGTAGAYRGHPVGVIGRLELRREALVARLDEMLGSRVHCVAGGPERTARVAVVTGGAAGEIATARAAGADTFITGEGAHHNYFDAEEGGINLLLGGHYATETWGVRALGAHLEQVFGVSWFFIDHPTGL